MATRSRDMSFEEILNEKPSLAELCEHIPITTKWYQMGILLNLSVKKLNEIEEESKDTVNLLCHMRKDCVDHWTILKSVFFTNQVTNILIEVVPFCKSYHIYYV